VKANQRNRKAFSLVEVAIAIAVAAFCLVTLVALFPTGNAENRDSLRRTIAASLATAVVSDLQIVTNASSSSSPIYGISVPSAGGVNSMTAPAQTLYAGIDGTTNTSPTAAGVVYRISVGFSPPASASRAATTARVLITWPAAAGGAATAWPTTYDGSFETQTAINCN